MRISDWSSDVCSSDLKLATFGLKLEAGKLPKVSVKSSSEGRAIVPPERVRYLADIADTVRGYHQDIARQARVARQRPSLRTAQVPLEARGKTATGFDTLVPPQDRH